VKQELEQEYGSCYYGLIGSLWKTTFNGSTWARVKSVRRVSFEIKVFCLALTFHPYTVRNDTFRTLATDLSFKGKVREDMLIRLLEAFAWKSKQNRAVGSYSGLPASRIDGGKGEKSQFEFAYVQGERSLSTSGCRNT
jgi:hypothetical protein